jgi:hypothetical protein
MENLLEVVRLNANVYLVKMRLLSGEILETKSHVKMAIFPNGEVIKYVTFESDAFQREIMLGNIQAREVTQAVIAAHSSAENK